MTISSNPKCVTSCSTLGYFANSVNHICDSCSSNCLTCAINSTNCLSCKVGDSWLNYICYTICPNQYYKNGINCTACDPTCSLCSGSSINCSACSAIAFLLNNTCYTTCPNPYYGDNNSNLGPNLCLSCDVSCSSCTGPANTNCIACKSNYTQSGSTCASACQPGYGLSSVSGICIACVLPCTDCFLSGTNCTKCEASPVQYYLYTVSGSTTCVSPCVVGYYPNTTSLVCVKCPNNCYNCSSNTVCYSCLPSKLFYKNLCYNSCPNGSYK